MAMKALLIKLVLILFYLDIAIFFGIVIYSIFLNNQDMKTILALLFGALFSWIVRTYFLMISDAIFGQIITGVVTIVIAYLAYRTNIKVNKVVASVGVVHNKVEEISHSVNGVKAELIESTKQLGEAVGKAQGRAEKAIELEPIIAQNIEGAKAIGKLEVLQELKEESKSKK